MLTRFLNLSYLYMVRACWRVAGPVERRRMVAIYLLLICSNTVGLTRPIVIGKVVTVVAQGGPEFYPHLLFWLAMMVGSMILFWVFMAPVRMLERRAALGLRQRFTDDLYRQVTSLSWGWHQANHTGTTLTRIQTATKAMYDFVDNQFDYWNSTFRLIGSTAVLAWIAPQVGLVIVIVVPPLYYVMRKFDLVTMKVGEERNEAERNFTAGMMDYIGNIGTVLALRLADLSRSNLAQRFVPLRRSLTKDMDVVVAKWVMFTVTLNVAWGVALLVYLTHQADLQSAIMAGTVVTVFQYLQQIDGAISMFASNYQGLLQHRINIQGVDTIIEAATAMPAISPPRPDLAAWRDMRLTGIAFRYEDQQHHVHQLDGVDLSLQRGRRVALVGSSGSGKSTLLRLLRHLHQPASGTLAVDGMKTDFDALSTLSTLIPQDAEIFENTIRYNITCGLATADAAVAEIVETACLTQVIAELPQGLDTDIRERGVNLSGGQKQRLALARGLFAARDSSLLLLDEPTSSLDAVTEAAIFDRLFAARQDACIVASLHRLHLLDRFDHVYVMERGQVVEQGTMVQLIEAGGRFTELWQAQKREDNQAST